MSSLSSGKTSDNLWKGSYHSIDFDPSHSYLCTIRSTQFALQAKSFIQIAWTKNWKEREAKNEKCKKSFFFFPCLLFWRRTKPNLCLNQKLPPPRRESNYAYELVGHSLILNEDQIRSIGHALPPRVSTVPWKLKFCTAEDGFSLHTLYRKLSKSTSSVLIVIETLDMQVFGVFSSCNLEVSERFYGTSECFLFTFNPDFQVFKWNGVNFYFVKGNEDSLSFGSSNGNVGLWIDSDLNKGRTEQCLTYANPPLIPEKDFVIRNLNCWTFG
jgi:hypothetical protein